MLQTYALQNAFQLVNTSEALVPLVGIEIQTRQQLVILWVELVSAWAMFADPWNLVVLSVRNGGELNV